jgi:hypothetical protein
MVVWEDKYTIELLEVIVEVLDIICHVEPSPKKVIYWNCNKL